MTALPNYTCYSPVESFGVELPSGKVALVDIVKFDLPDADTYSRYGLMVDGQWNANLVEMANISGTWRHIGMKRSAAFDGANALCDRANELAGLESQMKSGVITRKGKDFILGYEAQERNVRQYNQIVSLFGKYGIFVGRKMQYNHETKSVGFDRKRA